MIGASFVEVEKMNFRIRQSKDTNHEMVEEIWKKTALLRSVDQSRIYRMLVKTKFHLLLLAKVDGKVVGAVNAFYGRWVGYIHHLGVHPDYQRRGIGSHLLSGMCKQLRERKVRLAILFVPVRSTRRQHDDRIRFYRRNGFKGIGKMFVKKL